MSDALDLHAPPADLDVPAARLALELYDAARKRGVPNQQAWDEAVSFFAGHHPSWPMPLVEREAFRIVGALLAHQRSDVEPPPWSTRKIPLDLLVDLTTPETPESVRARARVEDMGTGAVSVFRGAWKLSGDVRPVSARLPPSRVAGINERMHV